jgi:hypothetical protein
LHPPRVPLPNGPCDGPFPSREGVSTLDADRLDLTGIDLTGLSREDVLAALTDAALEAFDEAGPAEFYSPDQARDWRGRWTSGGGEGAAPVPTHAERGQLRQASLQAVRDYVRAGGQPTQVENEQLAAHLARLTVDQLHAVKAEHGLKASAKDKAALVSKLAERFRAHRQTQEPAGAKALKEAVAGKPGFHNVREVVGGHAVTHGPTGSQVRADHAGTRFDVLTSGSTLHSSHATAAEAVKAAETSDRFGAGQSTAEQESRARHEAIANAQKRAAEKPGGLASDPHALAAAVTETAKALPNTAGHPRDPSTAGYTGHKVYISDVYDRLAPRLGGMTLEQFKARLLEGHLAGRLGLLRDDIMATQSRENAAKSVRSEVGHLNATFHTVDANAKASGSLRPPAAAPPAPAGGGKAGAFDPDAAGQSLRATVERHLETLRAAGGGLSRTSPRLTAAYKAVSAEAEAAVRDVVSRAPTAAALRAVARAYGIPALRGKDKESLAAELERAVRSRLQSFIRIHASYEGRRAGFSVAGALSSEEAEERAALRLAEAYADSVNARLRAVREGVRA